MLYVGSLIATYLWGKFIFGEKFSTKKMVSLGLLLVGLLIFVYPLNASTLSGGVLFGISAGLLEGSAHAFRKKLKNLKREILVLFQSLSGLLVGSLIFSLSGDNFTKGSITLVSVLVIILFGFLLVAIGYLLAYGFSHFDVNVGSVVLATELFFALIINFIFLKESPTTRELIGGVIIFIGSISTSINLNKLKKTTLKSVKSNFPDMM
jgi:drug/metabolite transporter (DMT)-like permease